MNPIQHNNHKQHLSRTKPRPIDRIYYPVCWLDSGSQFLNFIRWPGFFFEYIEKAFKINPNNVAAKSLNIIKELRKITNQPISSKFMSDITGKCIIPYINTQQQQDLSDKSLQNRTSWSLVREQDASEYIQYFFKMFSDIANIEHTPDCLIITDETTPLIKKMKTYINSHFTYTTSLLTVCLDKKQKSERPLELHREIQFSLTPYDDKPVSIQQLFNDHCNSSIVKEVDCEYCKRNHSNQHQTIFKSFKDCKYLIVQIKRWSTTTTKQENIITGLDKPIIVQSAEGLVVFFARASLNHIGKYIESGHYNTDVYFKNKLYNCDDNSTKPTTNFDGKHAYVVLLEKATLKHTNHIIKNYIPIIKYINKNVNKYKHIPYVQPTTQTPPSISNTAQYDTSSANPKTRQTKVIGTHSSRGHISTTKRLNYSVLSTKRKLDLLTTETDITGHVSEQTNILIPPVHKKRHIGKKNIYKKRGVKRNKPEQTTKKSTPTNKKQRPNKPTPTKPQVCLFYYTYIYNIYIYI